MALSPSDRVKYRTEIATRLSPKPWDEIDVILDEFGAPTEDLWNGAEYSYVLAMLKGIGENTLQQLAEFLNIETGEDSVLDLPGFWSEGQLRVFISHLAKHKVFASELQEALSVSGISSFIAHEDIEPDAEWQSEIEKALRTCDTLVALLHEGFNESTWTDQEVGYALGRGVPVFSVRLDIAPYGLFGKKQAFNGKGKSVSEIAHDLIEAYGKHGKTQEKLSSATVDTFCDSKSFADAKAKVALVERLETWNPLFTSKLREAVRSNSQIRDAWEVPGRVERLIAKRDPETTPPSPGSIDDEIPF